MHVIGSDREIQEYEGGLKTRKERLKHKPVGYSFEVSGVAKVQPGEQILVSFPLNHVDEYWYLRVKFALDLNNSSVAVGPFTYLPFYKWDIPKRTIQGSSKPEHPVK